jgi:NADH dehydrogenase [ubiquinone] 1 alpha subcomplex assembly factor 1
MNLLSIAIALIPATTAGEPVRIQAAVALEFALQEAAQVEADGPSVLDSLELGLRNAIQMLGPDSENGARIQRLQTGVRFEALLAGNDGAAWLQKQLPAVISDLRFEPVLEAGIPEGFPQWTPVGEIQIQEYPAYRMAQTTIQRSGSNRAFFKLFGHIKSQDIPMTAPVEMSYTVGEDRMAQSSMGFLYKSQQVGQANDEGQVQVVDIPAQLILSAGMRGFDTRTTVAQTTARLEDWLRANPEWTADGPLRTMVYNGPMVGGSKRYFEVQYPVKRALQPMIDFTDEPEAQRWRTVDDSVMGGRSASRMRTTKQGTSSFAGNLSIENNGGFASVRRAVAPGTMEGAESVTLRVRGDGKIYQLRFRTERGFSVASYQAEFPTIEGEWVDVEMPLSVFELKWRGRSIRDAPALDPARIRGIGLMIGSKQVGSFELELKSITQS